MTPDRSSLSTTSCVPTRTLDDGRSFPTRLDLHGAVRVGADGAYPSLYSSSTDPGPYQCDLSPGLYKVVTLRNVDSVTNTDGDLATCIYREDATAVQWQQSQESFGTDTLIVFLIVPDALARWVSLVQEELARNRQKDQGKLTIGDFAVWNNTCDIYDNIGKPDPFWDDLGLRFNDPAGGDGVGFSTQLSAYLHWGLDASGSRMAMMCSVGPD